MGAIACQVKNASPKPVDPRLVKRFSNVEKFHVLKSLTYFEDAELEPALRTLKEVNWETIKKINKAGRTRIFTLIANLDPYSFVQYGNVEGK